MQTSNEQPTRTVVLPTTVVPVIRRRLPWPFPAGRVRLRTDEISATAQAVIATTARAYLPDATSETGQVRVVANDWCREVG